MILVTGGTGLVGAHLLYKLANKGEQIRAIKRAGSNLDAVKTVFGYFSDDVDALFGTIEWVDADITELPSLTKAFEGVTHVYHAAALISFDPNDYRLLKKVNIEGTANVVNLCLSHNVKKLCYVSSIAALGEKEEGKVITEETGWNPEADNNSYAISKYGAEMEVWRGSQEGLNVVIVNPGVILGAGIWHSESVSLFGLVHKGFKYKVPGVVGYVDVEDVTKAMVKLMESDIVEERYILISENWSFTKFVTKTAEALSVKPPTLDIKRWMLSLGWRLDWIKSKILGKKRSLTRRSAKSAFTASHYGNEKIRSALSFEFIPLDTTIQKVAARFTSSL